MSAGIAAFRYADAARYVLRDLAAIWADHPDYDSACEA